MGRRAQAHSVIAAWVIALTIALAAGAPLAAMSQDAPAHAPEGPAPSPSATSPSSHAFDMASEAEAEAEDAAPADRMVVRGVRTPGPRLWLITDADTEIYVLALPTFIQAGIEWDDTAVRDVLDEADTLISDFDLTTSRADSARLANFAFQTMIFRRGRINMARGRSLEDVIDPVLAGEFQNAWTAAEAAKAARENAEAAGELKVTDEDRADALRTVSAKRMHPVFQAARLQEAAMEGAGLVHNEAIVDQVRRLARRRGVTRVSTNAYDMHMADVKQIVRQARRFPQTMNEACIGEAIAYAQDDIPRHAQIADAWARGDVDGLRRLAPGMVNRDVCFRLMETHLGGFSTLDGRSSTEFVDKDIWFDRLMGELERPGVRLAMVSAASWLAPEDGVMARLEAAGVTVSGP